ncbi:hypothetical protein N7532_007459 [Penicillium argentinense]|uniref:Uncharacterized protein n=1 Tax=Penicillium argentinense TaxID=1131581 RepID=A0A9W9F7T0_9EURO|nr:uncharacterized protein N7532_007459 [Penicillium argentinense]KAJ5095168.1 hypothetical protein N7532_007459 [Penicillium argentinense]
MNFSMQLLKFVIRPFVLKQSMRRMSDYIDTHNPTSSHYKQALEKLRKSAEMTVTLASELQRQFDTTQAATAARLARRNASRRHARITGVISPSQFKEIKRKQYKLSEEADQKRQRQRWKKVLVEIRKYG